MAQNLRICAAYIRVSTDDQAELSPDAQLRVILEDAKKDGFIIPPEYIFEEKKGISGRKAGVPEDDCCCKIPEPGSL